MIKVLSYRNNCAQFQGNVRSDMQILYKYYININISMLQLSQKVLDKLFIMVILK